MTKKTRRLLFYLATILFILVSYTALLYAEGYKYSFSSHRFIRTGTIYVRANTPAQVFLDGQLVGTTSFLSNSESISSLLPGSYKVSVQKDGHSTWQKNINVNEGFVSEFSRVMILPQSGDEKTKIRQEIKDLLYPSISPTPSPTPTPKASVKPTPKSSPTPTPVHNEPYYLDNDILYVRADEDYATIAHSVKNFMLSGDGDKILYWNDNDVFVYWLADTNYQPYHIHGDIEHVAHFSMPIKAISWFRDSDHVVIDIGNYKILELDARGGLNVITL